MNLANSLNPGRHAIAADQIFDGDKWHAGAALLVQDGNVLAVVPRAEVPADWRCVELPSGTILAAGFIDLQVNGGGGVLLNDRPTADGMRTIAAAHRRYGTTGCLPTLITDTRDKMRTLIAAARSLSNDEGVLGVHLEGPFISPRRPGVHRQDLIAQIDSRDLEELAAFDRNGRSLITLAPECVPQGTVRKLVNAGLRVSIGHSEASAVVVTQAVEEGATGVTHLFNAMPAMSAREPGIVGAALSDTRLTAGLIVDGIHVDPVSVRTAFAAKGADGIALITDAMPTVGTSLHEFELDGRKVTLSNGRLTTDQGTLAGAHLNMAAAVRNAVTRAHVPLEDALRAAALTPARFLGLEGERGALKAGCRADVVALSSTLDVIETWLGGAPVGVSGTLQ